MPRLAGKKNNTGLYVVLAIVLIIILLVLLQTAGVIHLLPASK
ncbi:MAG: hypothetical protein NVS4B8_08050 [Herpetosiphon sp.]